MRQLMEVAISPRPGNGGVRRIFRNAQRQIDHIWSSSLPVDMKLECCWDVIFQAGRDLDRLAAHGETAVMIKMGGVGK